MAVKPPDRTTEVAGTTPLGVPEALQQARSVAAHAAALLEQGRFPELPDPTAKLGRKRIVERLAALVPALRRTSVPAPLAGVVPYPERLRADWREQPRTSAITADQVREMLAVHAEAVQELEALRAAGGAQTSQAASFGDIQAKLGMSTGWLQYATLFPKLIGPESQAVHARLSLGQADMLVQELDQAQAAVDTALGQHEALLQNNVQAESDLLQCENLVWRQKLDIEDERHALELLGVAPGESGAEDPADAEARATHERNIEAMSVHLENLQHELQAAQARADAARAALQAEAQAPLRNEHATREAVSLEPQRERAAALRDTLAQKAATVSDQVKEWRGLFAQSTVAALPGFNASAVLSAAAAPLRLQLQAAAERLETQGDLEERDMSAGAKLEILSRAAALATGGDAERAAGLIEALMSRRPEHWLGGADTAQGVQGAHHEDIARVYRLMTLVPRGIELLGDIAAPREPGQDKVKSAVLQVFWTADLEMERLRGLPPDDEGRGALPWLERAQQGGRAKAAIDPGAPPDDAARMAYNGVRNGFLSDQPGSDFERVGQQLQEAGQQLLAQHQRSNHPAWSIARTLAKPFIAPKASMGETVRDMALSQTAASGIPNALSDAADKVLAAAAGLAERARLQTEAPGSSAADVGHARWAVLQAVATAVAHPPEVKPRSSWFGGDSVPVEPYRAKISADQLEEVNLRISQLADSEREAGALPVARGLQKLMKHPPGDALALLHEVLDVLATDAAKMGFSQAKDVRSLWPKEAQQAVDVARGRPLTSAEELVEFLNPLLDGMRLRDSLNMAVAKEAGGNVPIPLAPAAGVLASLSLQRYKRTERTLGLNNARFAIEIQVGSAEAKITGGKLNLAYGLEAGVARFAPGGVNLKLSAETGSGQGVSLQLLREKDDAGVPVREAAAEVAKQVLHDALAWQGQNDDTGQPFAGPLQLLLARHDDLLVPFGERAASRTTASVGLESAVAVRAGPARFRTGVQVVGKAEFLDEHTRDVNGMGKQRVVTHAQQSRYRLSAEAHASASVIPGAKKITVNGTSVGRVTSALPMANATRSIEIGNGLAKKGAILFPIGEKQGGAMDRTFANAGALLKEIALNREAWLLRCIDTLPKPVGDDPVPTDAEKLAMANLMLKSFENDLRAAKNDPRYQFTVKYELQPAVSGLLDSCRALKAIAELAGDTDTANIAQQAAADLLATSLAWAPKTLSVRLKGKSSVTAGWSFLWHKTRAGSAEASSVASAFPR